MKPEIKKLLDEPRKEEEAQACPAVLDLFKNCYPAAYKEYEKLLWSQVLYVGEKGYWHEIVSLEESKKVLSWIKKEPIETFIKKLEKFESISRQVDQFFEQITNTNNNLKDLPEIIHKSQEFGQEFYGISIIGECLDVMDEKEFQSLVSNHENPAESVKKLSTPDRIFFLTQEKLDLLEIKEKFKENYESNDAIEALKAHTKKYFWIQNGFSKAKVLDVDFFKKQLQEISLNKEEIHKATHLWETVGDVSESTKEFFTKVRLFAYQQDRRKVNVMKLGHCMKLCIEIIAKELNHIEEKLWDYTPDELIELVTKNKEVKDLDSRKNVAFYNTVERDGIKVSHMYGTEAKEILDYYLQKRKEGIDTIKGMVACKGDQKTISGTARIVFDPVHDEFNDGEILVTGMTRPEFVPLMKKAKAIVTNEGGITTHAAIVSRELNVPCIIGTRIATDLIKTGDKITLNLEKGEVTHETQEL